MEYSATSQTSPQSDSEVRQTKRPWIAAMRDLLDLPDLNKEVDTGDYRSPVHTLVLRWLRSTPTAVGEGFGLLNLHRRCPKVRRRCVITGGRGHEGRAGDHSGLLDLWRLSRATGVS